MVRRFAALFFGLAFVLGGVTPTIAAPLYAKYRTIAGDVVAIYFDGVIQSDGDTVHVDTLLMPATFNGATPAVAGATLQSFTNQIFSDGAPPTLSFSGSTMNFSWIDPADNDGIIFDDSLLTFNTRPIFAGGPSFGDTFEDFVPANWSLAAVETFNAVYETSAGDVISFMVDGVRDSNGDTVEIVRLLMPATFNGATPAVAGATLQSFTNQIFSDNAPPTLSFSGSTMNFSWTDPAINDGIVFDDSLLTFNTRPIFAGGPSFGDTFEDFIPENWSLTLKIDEVPEPSTDAILGVMALGLIVIAGIGGRIRDPSGPQRGTAGARP